MANLVIHKEYISSSTTYAQNVPKYIVIHETDNFSKGANAKRHASAQAAGHLSCSVHYYSGSDGVYQAAEHSRGTYSVGKEYGGNHSVHDATNRNTINIEICVNPDGDYTIAWKNCVELVKYLINTTGIPADRVIRHFDAKGKYCPRKMMDDPSLWAKFKSEVSGITTDIVKEDNIADTKEIWYRIGKSWENGICVGQVGAYRNKDIAIRDCDAGYKVFDNEGLTIYTNPVTLSFASNGYDLSQFVREVQQITGSKVDGIAGEETLNNTITVSRIINKFHPVITPLERRLKHLGFYNGAIEADTNETPCFGIGLESAVIAYQKHVLSYQNPDGEITAKKKMWLSLLGMDID